MAKSKIRLDIAEALGDFNTWCRRLTAAMILSLGLRVMEIPVRMRQTRT